MKENLAINGGDPVTTMPPLKNTIGAEELDAISRVVRSGVLSSFRGGNNVHSFENAFADYVGAQYAIATTSGTSALHASVAALDLSPTDEVLVPALTFVSTASVVLQEGARVVFVDIDDTLCMSAEDLGRKITPNSRAIIPVHLYGQPADMSAIMSIAKAHDLLVIEDACQSHGAELDSRKTGSLGDIGCFSFFQTKNMTCGEGGMITTSSSSLYEKIRLKREHGSPHESSTWYNYKTLGYNYNLTEIQAAIGEVQLAKLDKMNLARQANAMHYDNYLSDLPLELPSARLGVKHVRHNYPVLLPENLASKRKFIVDALKAEGIPCDIAYPCPLYNTKLFDGPNFNRDCPYADNKSQRLVTLFTDSTIDEELIQLTQCAFYKIFTYLESLS